MKEQPTIPQPPTPASTPEQKSRLEKIIHFFFDTKQGEIRFVLKAYPLSAILGLISGIVVFLILPPQESRNINDGIIGAFVGYVIFAPLCETLLMIPIFKLLNKITSKILFLSIMSAIIWGALHSSVWAPWGLGVFLSFLVFSFTFLVWKKESLKKAFWVTSSVHALDNLTWVLLGLLIGIY